MLAEMIWERYRYKIHGIHVHMQLSNAQGLTYWGKKKIEAFYWLANSQKQCCFFSVMFNNLHNY